MPSPEEHAYAAQVLIVDDEPDHAEVMAEALKRMGHVCTIVHDAGAAAEELRHGNFDLVVTDLVMDGEQDGMRVLEAARRTQVNAETIMVTAHGDVPTAKAALRGGAYDFIEKPLDLEVFRNLSQRAIETVALRGQNRSLKQQVDDRFGLEGIIGSSPGIQRVISQVRQVALSDIPVLITGESGTGKELVAKAIHQNSRRARKHYKPLNCAGLSDSILESELFGSVPGAFTDARDREGVFEYANGGTLFLDEIGDMPLTMQPKLLRVLESGEVVRVGANEPRHVNVRLVSATNHDLKELIEQGQFRQDLFFRIAGVHIQLPPLRERREDIPALVRHYVEKAAAEMGRQVREIEEPVMQAFMQYGWPGNVRQMLNAVRSAVLMCTGDTLKNEHIPAEVRLTDVGPASEGSGSLAGLTLDQIEKQSIRQALRVNNGNREATARMLGIGERTLYRKLKEYGLK